MKAIVFHEHGPVDRLQLESFPDPVCGSKDAIIEVAATSLNGFDPMILAGTTGLKTPLPMVPCGDMAGSIAELGSEVDASQWRVGDRVCPHPFVAGEGMTGETRLGAASEFVRIPASNLLPIPDGVSFEQAASLPIAYGTAVETSTGGSGASLPSSGAKKNNNETLKKDKVKSSTGVSSSSLASSEATENNVDAIEKEADDNEKSLNDLFKKGKAKRSLRIAKAPKKNVSQAKVIVKKSKDNKKSKFASGVSSASSRSLRSSGRGKKPKEPEKKSKRNVQSSSS